MCLRLWPLFLPVAQVLAAAPAQTFVLLDGASGKTAVENEARARERFAPCSTFKIPNSLVALESGIVPDAHMTIAYDPARDGSQHGSWALDHDLASAMRFSVAWYYRELARRTGPARMRQFLDRFDYGNRDISSGIDRFWLGDALRISAYEQIAFLRRFREDRLGVSLRSSAILREILLLEATGLYRWYGKTGTCTDAVHGPVAWHIGWVERAGEVSYYALNLNAGSVDEAFARRNALIREKLSAAGLIDPQLPTPRRRMEALIRGAIDAFPGVVSLYARNLDTGETFGIRENERVRTASTIKLPVMAAVYAAVAKGKVKWDDLVPLREEDKVSGSGVLHEFSPGKLPLRDLVRLMIVVSDNTATNLVLDRVPAGFVNTEMAALGLRDTRVLRKVLGAGAPSGHSREGLMPEFQRFGLGVSTPREMVALIERIARGEVVSPEASREMLATLRRQQYKDAIGRHLPGSVVASKSGSLDRLRSDVGLVDSRGGRIALALTVDDMLRTDYSPGNTGNILLSQLTRMLVDGLSAPVRYLGAPEKIVELHAPIDHPQGIEVEGNRLWVTWVNRQARTGHLGEFDLATGKLLRAVTLRAGERYHPGGLAADGQSLWVPVAEYRPNSSTAVQRRNRDTLALESQFEVPDHIGCLAVSETEVFGGNWDSRQIYRWDRAGRLLGKTGNPTGTSYQDLKFDGGRLVGGGLRADGGAIDWLEPSGLRLVERIRVGKTDRGALLTREGMAVSGGRLYLLPEDSPPRLFIFRPVP